MNILTDQQLLCDYVEHRSEAAFAELVRRHVDLVYSAAWRMVPDSHLAKDVAQGTFIALAQNASQLAGRPALSGWLHCTARNLAAKTIRSEVRRHSREKEAAAMNELLSDGGTGVSPVWSEVAPHLDDALGELNEADRDALMLRYFENKNLREVGATLGTSDDAAQKRVSRAIERLREFLAKRGVAVGASGLAVVISANAVQAAPIGLAVTISTATTVAGTTIVATATKAIAMTTLQKTLVAATVAVLTGAGIYEARQAALLREENQTLQQQQAPLAEQLRELQRERDAATNRLALLAEDHATTLSNNTELLKLRGEVARLRAANGITSTTQTDSREALMKSWLAREEKLKQVVEQNPERKIPDLQLLSEEDWLNAAKDASFDTDEDVRRTLAHLRNSAGNKFANIASDAVSKYMKANNGQFPTDVAQLQPFFPAPISDAILQRWGIVPQTALPNQRFGGDWLITVKEPIDREFDSRWAIGPVGYGSTGYEPVETERMVQTLNPAVEAYAADHNGTQPADPSQI